MRNTTHEVIGVSLGLAAGQALEAGPFESVGLAVAAVAGARLPDIDQLGARVHMRTRLERRSLIIGVVAMRLPLVAFAGIVSHRALTHSASHALAQRAWPPWSSRRPGPALRYSSVAAWRSATRRTSRPTPALRGA